MNGWRHHANLQNNCRYSDASGRSCAWFRAQLARLARPALISLLSLSTISVGVFLGTPRPDQLLAS
jgi:hypothetical protein